MIKVRAWWKWLFRLVVVGLVIVSVSKPT